MGILDVFRRDTGEKPANNTNGVKAPKMISDNAKSYRDRMVQVLKQMWETDSKLGAEDAEERLVSRDRFAQSVPGAMAVQEKVAQGERLRKIEFSPPASQHLNIAADLMKDGLDEAAERIRELRGAREVTTEHMDIALVDWTQSNLSEPEPFLERVRAEARKR